MRGTGNQVTSFKRGDRVFGTELGSTPRGTYADFVNASANRMAHLPNNTSPETGAALPHVGVTAWQALFTHADLATSESCLIHGGSGGVGHIAVQLALNRGAFVIATVGSNNARTRLEELGADSVYGYDRRDPGATIKNTINGVDVMIDHRFNDYLALDLGVAASKGEIIVLYGGFRDVPNASKLLSKELTIQGMGTVEMSDTRSILDQLAILLNSDNLTVDIDHKFGLDEVAEAQRTVIESSFIGKVVITL